MNVCIVAGHSGGHILPCLTIARKEKKSIVAITTTTPLDQAILKKQPDIHAMAALPLQRLPRTVLHIPIFFTQLIYTCIASAIFFKKHNVERVITTGGLIAVPACLSARFLRIPIDLYELNVEPGKAARMLARFIKKVFICFKETRPYLPYNECVLTEYPVRFTNQNKKVVNRPSPYPTLFILGGSQGSRFLNDVIYAYIEEKKPTSLRIIHQTGAADNRDWQAFYQQHGIEAIVFDYHEHIEEYYQQADLILCRAGAGTLAEILFFEKPCIVIPLRTKTTAHQVKNVIALAKRHQHIQYCEQENFNHDLLEKKLSELTRSPNHLFTATPLEQ